MPPLYTAFVALQDISADMGPTIFLPRTNDGESHRRFNNSSDTQRIDYLAGQEARVALLQKGDVALFDARCLHCGGANISCKRRVLFFITITNPAAAPHQSADSPAAPAATGPWQASGSMLGGRGLSLGSCGCD